MDERVIPIRPNVDDDLAVCFENVAWLSTAVSIDSDTGERPAPFETFHPRDRGDQLERPRLHDRFRRLGRHEHENPDVVVAATAYAVRSRAGRV